MPLHARFSYLRSSFQYKLFCVFTLLSAFVSIIFCSLYIATEINKERAHISEQLQLQARHLSDSIRLPLYAEDSIALSRLATETISLPEISAVVITAHDGRVLAQARTTAGDTSADTFSETVQVHSSPLGHSPETAFSGGSNSDGALIGSVHIERGSGDLHRMTRTLVLVSCSAAIGFWLLVSLFSHLALQQVTRSFNALMHGIDAMQKGDFTSRIDIVSDDEPGRAAYAVNTLANVLQQRSEENIRLQEERLALERQMFHSQKLESLGVMAGGIAHDYNNLLQSILGNIELASIKLDPDSSPHKYISNAMTSGKHAAHLTNLMLTYVGKGFINKKELNLNELVRENAEMLKTAASSAVSTELRLSEELPAICADEANIQQVVMNLIINATEAILVQPGFIRITTGVQDCDQAYLSGNLLDEKPAPGRFVFLEVSDNGCGMSEETIRRLFDPFFTTKFTGRGLGMSAVMGIIRLHNGALFVESRLGTGTTFRVLFPVAESTPRATSTEPAPAPAEHAVIPEKLISGTVLVVDDEKQVLRVCRKMVELCGFTVITACDGIDAITKFREHADEIVAVLLDLTMPNMDGITAMGEILSIRPGIKVILSSGFNEAELSERITNHAPAGFIRKPYTMSVLETELRRIVQAA